MFKSSLFRDALFAHQKTIREAASAIGVNEATLYRKISGKSDFTRNEIQLLRQFLYLTSEEVDSIFFATDIA